MARPRPARCPPARLAKGTRGLFVRRDRYWGGKHAAGEERALARAGRAGRAKIVPSRPRGRGAGGGGGRCWRGARRVGRAAAAARRCGARGAGEGDPPPPGRACAAPTPLARRLRRRRLPARRAWRRAARKTRAGAGRGRGPGGAKSWSGPRAPGARPLQGRLWDLTRGLQRGVRLPGPCGMSVGPPEKCVR